MYHSLFKNGKVLAKGDLYQRPEYARTLEIIADRGPQALYEGDIAEAIITVVRDRGGLMTMTDLKGESKWCVQVYLIDLTIEYTPIWREPISLNYGGNTLWTVPAPASGAIWLSAMGTLGQFDPAPAGSVLDYHRVTEALRVSPIPFAQSAQSSSDCVSWHMARERSWAIQPLCRVWRNDKTNGSLLAQ